MTTAPPLELERAVRQRAGKTEGAEIRFRCPHPERHRNGDEHPSARYHTSKHVWCCDVCEAGGGWRSLADLLDVPVTRPKPGQSEVVASYEYRDEEGRVLRRKVRWEPGFQGRRKSFTWEEPDGRGGWTKCTGGGNPGVLYHSECLPAARDEGRRVLVVEGEKDADRAAGLGLVAVCNPEGAGRGKWKARYSEQLRGLEAVVIADRDTPGRAHAAAVATSLQGVASSVRLLELPGDGVKDLSDWVEGEERSGKAAAAVVAALESIATSAPLVEPAADGDGAAGETDDPASEVLGALEQLGEEPDLDELETLLRNLALATAGRDDLGRELVRERAVRALQGTIQAPGRTVDAALKAPAEGLSDIRQGHALTLEDPEPWTEEVEGAVLLEELEETFRRFLVLPEGAGPALALWTLHTYAHDAATVSPLLAVTSPEKRCGKTTLLSLLVALVRRALPASNITAAALFRAVEHFQPTLVIDEADSFLDEREELRGILNSGHTRETAFVVRTAGDDHEPRSFSTWAPKAIALIGRLPSTVEDRAIPVRMKRKAPGETVERLRMDRIRQELAEVRRRAARWAQDHAAALADADPETPAGLHDRAADNWRPLLAIADAAGGAWPEKARAAAKRLSDMGGDDSSIRVQLLADIRAAFAAKETDRLFTQDLLRLLIADESKPWGEWKAGKPLSAVQLSRLLKPFGIGPQKIRIGGETRQGYRAEDFAEAFERYLHGPNPSPTEPEHPEHFNGDGGFEEIPTRNTAANVPGRHPPESSMATGVVPGVPAREGVDLEGEPPEKEVFEL